jgi:hypothetical protein
VLVDGACPPTEVTIVSPLKGKRHRLSPTIVFIFGQLGYSRIVWFYSGGSA